MKKIILFLLLFASIPAFAFGQIVGGASVQTNQATNVSAYQANLQGQINMPYFGGYNYVYFQWGQTTAYGNQTDRNSLYGSGSFSQTITSLTPNTTYHFRAIAEVNNLLIYGQDMTFYTNNYSSSGSLSVSKKVINLTSGNLSWFPSVNANPSDVLSFAITLQANNQEVHNVVVYDTLPQNLFFDDGVLINTTQYSNQNIASGINVGTVYPGQAVVVTYRARVAQDAYFSYGTTALTSTATITSNETGTQTANTSVIINKTGVSGASIVSTGLTNNFLVDSFLLPLLLIISGLWFYFSGNVNKFADRLKIVLKK